MSIKFVEYNNEFEFSDDTTKNERRSICETCESNVESTCGECSCIIEVRISYKESYCPKGKW